MVRVKIKFDECVSIPKLRPKFLGWINFGALGRTRTSVAGLGNPCSIQLSYESNLAK